MNSIVTFFTDAFKSIRTMGLSDVLDILIVAIVVYAGIAFIRRTNSIKVANGLLLLVLGLWLSSALNLSVTNFLLRQVFEIGILAVIILFQPEIRRALEKVGSSKFFSIFGREWGTQGMEHVIMQTVYACEDMAKSRTGALIVFERDNRLNDTVNTGTLVDAHVSTELIKNVFYDKSPLHDGAAIIKDGRLYAAGCMLPLSSNANLSRELGMRHRAGIGITEHTDAVAIIVSEETGGISVAVDGLLKRHLSLDTFEALLRRELLPAEETERLTWRERLLQRKGTNNAEEKHNRQDNQ